MICIFESDFWGHAKKMILWLANWGYSDGYSIGNYVKLNIDLIIRATARRFKELQEHLLLLLIILVQDIR